LPHRLEYTWLTRNEHLSDEFRLVNPRQQVPALKHGDFCLSEATAIMQYLTDVNDCTDVWFGAKPKERALVNKHLSWYHTNIRKVLTLEYFLPILLMPAYLGFPRPDEAAVERALESMHAMLAQLDDMLFEHEYLAGGKISAADLLFASEITAIKLDPNFHEILNTHCHVKRWLHQLQDRAGYKESHKVWETIVPIVKARPATPDGNPEWVAQACEQVIFT